MRRYSTSPWIPFVAGAVAAVAARLITDSLLISLLVAVVVGLLFVGLVAAWGSRRPHPDS